MNPASVVVLLLVLLGMFLALRAIAQHKTGGCSGCTGDCAHCEHRK